MTSYSAVFSRQALGFVASADDEAFAEIDEWVARIERAPSTPSDYTEPGRDGRLLHVTVLHHTTITYWPDHAAREVRVLQIEANWAE